MSGRTRLFSFEGAAQSGLPGIDFLITFVENIRRSGKQYRVGDGLVVVDPSIVASRPVPRPAQPSRPRPPKISISRPEPPKPTRRKLSEIPANERLLSAVRRELRGKPIIVDTWKEIQPEFDAVPSDMAQKDLREIVTSFSNRILEISDTIRRDREMALQILNGESRNPRLLVCQSNACSMLGMTAGRLNKLVQPLAEAKNTYYLTASPIKLFDPRDLLRIHQEIEDKEIQDAEALEKLAKEAQELKASGVKGVKSVNGVINKAKKERPSLRVPKAVKKELQAMFYPSVWEKL